MTSEPENEVQDTQKVEEEVAEEPELPEEPEEPKVPEAKPKRKTKPRPDQAILVECSRCGKQGTHNYIKYNHECSIKKISPKKQPKKQKEQPMEQMKAYEPSSPKHEEMQTAVQRYRSIAEQRNAEKKAMYKSWLST